MGLSVFGASPWPEIQSDLPPDARGVWGILPNGMRYVILPNAEPQNRISLRLLVKVGSLHEREDERGVAHFVEHMIYRGTRSHPGDKLNKMLESRGIGNGPDSNAFTNFDHTIFHLELPDAREPTLRMGLQTFREYAEEARIDTKYLAAERGVILSEKAMRVKPDFILRLANFSFLWPDSLQLRRTPIGLDQVIRNCTRRQLIDFYNAWYRPERMGIIVVGEIDPAAAERMIRVIFSSLKARAPARPEPAGLIPTAAASPTTHVCTDPVFNGVSFILEHPAPSPRLADTHSRRVELLHQALAFSMLQNRLEKYSHAHEGTFVSPQVLIDYPALEWQNVMLTAAGSISGWRKAAESLEQEHRRAFLNGFNHEELRVAKARFAAAYEQSVRSAASRSSEALATVLAGHLLRGAIFTTPQTLQSDLAADLESATVLDCRRAFRAAWSTQAARMVGSQHHDDRGNRDGTKHDPGARPGVPQARVGNDGAADGSRSGSQRFNQTVDERPEFGGRCGIEAAGHRRRADVRHETRCPISVVRCPLSVFRQG